MRLPCGIEASVVDGRIVLERRMEQVPRRLYLFYSTSLLLASSLAAVFSFDDYISPIGVAKSAVAALAVWRISMFILAVEDEGEGDEH